MTLPESSNRLSRAAVVSAAREFLGVPFAWQGRDPKVGLDCAGLVRCVLDRLSYADGFDCTDYATSAQTAQLRDAFAGLFTEIDAAEVGAGDLVLIRTPRPSWHCAFVTASEPLTILHAHVSLTGAVSRVVEHAMPHDLGAVVAAYRLRGLVD